MRDWPIVTIEDDIEMTAEEIGGWGGSDVQVVSTPGVHIEVNFLYGRHEDAIASLETSMEVLKARLRALSWQ